MRYFLLLSIMLVASHLAAQSTNLNLVANAPTNVANTSGVSVSPPGTNTYYYWIVANYPIGKVAPNGPAVASRVQAPSVSTPITVSWVSIPGVINYDVLRTTTQAPPRDTATIAVATAQTGSSFSDIGGALSSYTVTFVSSALASMTLDNQTASAPFINVNITTSSGSTNYQMVLNPATGIVFTGLGSPVNGTSVFCSNCTVTSPSDNTCVGSGTGAAAFRLNGAWKCFQ